MSSTQWISEGVRPVLRYLNGLPEGIPSGFPPRNADGVVDLNDGSQPWLRSRGPEDALPALLCPKSPADIDDSPWGREIKPLVRDKLGHAIATAVRAVLLEPAVTV